MTIDDLIESWTLALAPGGRLDGDPTAASTMLGEAIHARGATVIARDPRLTRQCVRIVELLRERGPTGATSADLSKIALKYTGRLSEVRAAGFVLETAYEGPAVHRYFLRAEPDDPDAALRQLALPFGAP